MTTPLRPLSTGELLDRSFSLYRNNFALFAGIALLPSLLKLGLDGMRLATTSGPFATVGRRAAARVGMDTAAMGGTYFLLLIIYLLGFILASGATVYAVSAVHMDKSVTISGSYKAIRPSLMRLIGIFLLMGVIIFALAIPLIGVPVFGLVSKTSAGLAVLGLILGGLALVHVYVCLSLATPACVVEKSRILNSLRRSLALTKGAKWKIWLVFVLFIALELALYGAVGIPAAIIGFKTGSPLLMVAIFAIGEFFVSTFVTPIMMIPLVLIYYDQRVRKEAFDLLLMMQSLDQKTPDQVAATTPIG
jgi:hypothetical protein